MATGDKPLESAVILVVDDALISQKLMRKILCDKGYSVRQATNGEIALQSIAEIKPDLVLLDVKMPKMDGYEVCKQLKANEATRKIPVIFISALDDSADILTAYETGGVDYITKPFQPVEVLARVKTHLALRRLQTQMEAQNALLQEEIHERIKVEQALKKTLEETEDLYNHAPCGYHSLSKDGVIVRINETELKWLGYTKEEVIGKFKFASLLTEKGKKVFNKTFPLMKKNGHIKDIEQELVRKDGSILPVILNGTVIYDSNGEFVMSRSTVFDITDRKETEEQLRQNDRIMMQQSRLAAMGEMIGNIAHQWRQPLNTLGLNIQRLSYFYEIGTFDAEFLNKTVTDAMKLIQHMSKTIDDFRNFFRIDKQKTSFSANQAIHQTIALVEESFRSNQLKIITHSEGEPWIYGYPNEYSQAFLNILQNARDAFIERGIQNALVTVKTFVENDRTIVTVADNAGGIPEEIIDKIFDPYFSTKGPQGTGIGLFMAKNIIEKNMGGRISAQNTEEGVEFRIEV